MPNAVHCLQAQQRGLSSTQVGVVLAGYTATQAILSPILGPKLPIMGIRTAIVGGCVVSALTTAGLGLLPWSPDDGTGWTFFALSLSLRIFDAVGTILISVSAFALINIRFADRSEAVFVSSLVVSDHVSLAYLLISLGVPGAGVLRRHDHRTHGGRSAVHCRRLPGSLLRDCSCLPGGGCRRPLLPHAPG